MKYEEPKMWLIESQETDVITLSGVPSGDGDSIDPDYGGWG